nr:DUF6886 family protein [Nocardia sp. XZ_19_385]
MAWSTPTTVPGDRERILGPGGGDRVHAIEYSGLDALQSVALFAYRLPAHGFQPIGEPEPYAMVSTDPVDPLGPPEPVGDLVHLHEQAGIQLRVLPNLWPFWDAVTASSLGFSGIRMRQARPRP